MREEILSIVIIDDRMSHWSSKEVDNNRVRNANTSLVFVISHVDLKQMKANEEEEEEKKKKNISSFGQLLTNDVECSHIEYEQTW